MTPNFSENLSQVIARKLRRGRRIADLTQEQAANKLGVTPGAVSDWERGVYYPTMSKLELASELYDRPVWWFLHPSETTEEDEVPA